MCPGPRLDGHGRPGMAKGQSVIRLDDRCVSQTLPRQGSAAIPALLHSVNSMLTPLAAVEADGPESANSNRQRVMVKIFDPQRKGNGLSRQRSGGNGPDSTQSKQHH